MTHPGDLRERGGALRDGCGTGMTVSVRLAAWKCEGAQGRGGSERDYPGQPQLIWLAQKGRKIGRVGDSALSR